MNEYFKFPNRYKVICSKFDSNMDEITQPLEAYRFEIDCVEEFFDDYFPSASFAEITFAWNTDGPFYKGKSCDNEPDLILAQADGSGEFCDKEEMFVFAHKNFLEWEPMAKFKDLAFLEKLKTGNSLDYLVELPTILLGVSALWASWTIEELNTLENEFGEDYGYFSTLEIREAITKQRSLMEQPLQFR